MLKRFFKASLSALVVVAAASGTAHAAGTFCSSGKTVHFAGITWESGAFATEVLRQILEKGYGCATSKARTVPMVSASTAFPYQTATMISSPPGSTRPCGYCMRS